MGDLNAQNSAWGSSSNNNKGRNLLEALNDSDVIILNNGIATRVTLPNQGNSCPDITLVSNDIAAKCNWERLDDPGNSDHFPTLCTFSHENFIEQRTQSKIKWNLKKANWEVYSNHLLNETPITWNEWKQASLRAAENCLEKTTIQPSKSKRVGKPI